MSHEYTIIVMNKDEWNNEGKEIKDLLKKYNILWQSSKIKSLDEEHLNDIKEKFKIEDLIWEEDSKEGLWENENHKIKIVMASRVSLIYKGNKGKDNFYKDFVKISHDTGFLAMKIIDGQVVFKDRINLRMIKRLNDDKGEKKVRVENFKKKIKIYRDLKWDLVFIEKWINEIEKEKISIYDKEVKKNVNREK